MAHGTRLRNWVSPASEEPKPAAALGDCALVVKDRFSFGPPLGSKVMRRSGRRSQRWNQRVSGSLFGGCTPLPLAREGEFLESASAVIRGAHL